MRTKAFLVALFLLACLAPAPLAADKDQTELAILVMDEAKDRPLPKASVTVHFVKGRKMFVKKVRGEWNSKTNSKGVCEFPGMPPGNIRVQVIAPGFQTFGDEFEISGDRQTLTVKLKRPSNKQVSAHEETPPQGVSEEKKKPQ